jgi:hypothetical protein
VSRFTNPTSVISSFFDAYAYALDTELFQRLLTSCLNNTRSSNAVTRAASADLFKSIVGKARSVSDVKAALDEILSLPKAGKTSGADHRVALYTMLGDLPQNVEVSPVLVQAVLSLLVKETHDSVVSVLAASLTPHLVLSLRENIVLSAESCSSIAKGMNDAKPVIRREFCSSVGNALWELENVSSKASETLVKAILPSMDTNLKTVSGSPTSVPSGPLEGYIAIALLLGPIRRGGRFGMFATCMSYYWFNAS